MKRLIVSMTAMALFSLFAPAALHAQFKFYSNAKPMSIAQNLKTYYTVQRTNLTRWCGQVPEDVFFKTPPGYSKEAGIGSGEQASIGDECAHATDDNFNMCELMLTGAGNSGRNWKGTQDRPGTDAVKVHTKAAVMTALEASFRKCDQVIDNFKDDMAGRMVMSQHALQPMITTIMNEVSHTREVAGRVLSYMVVFGIKAAPGMNAADPANPNDDYYCAGQVLKIPDPNTVCR